MRIETVAAAQDLPRCQAAWEDLHRHAPAADVFNSYGWVTAWLDSFWANRPIHFELLWEGSRLLAVVPLVVDHAGEIGCRQSLVALADRHAPRYDILAAAPADEVWRAVLPELRSSRPVLPLLLKRLPAQSHTRAAIERVAPQLHLRTHLREEDASYSVAVAAGWSSFLAGLSKHTRSELQRKRRVLERAGATTLRVLTSAADADAAVAAVLEIEAASWKESVRTSLHNEPGVAFFFATIMRRCAESGTLRVYLLCVDDRPIAHVTCAAERHALYALKTSFRADHAAVSPGAVLMSHVIEDACRRGEAVVELLGAEERWKREIATGRTGMCSLCVFGAAQARCRFCRMKEQQLKPIVRSHAPFAVRLRRKLREPGHP